MNKLKTLVVTALAATTIGTGALAAASPASDSHASAIGAGKITFNPFSITKK
jgi:hypothetical protein